MSGGQKRPTGRIAVPSLVAGLFTLSDVDIEFIDEESRDQPGQEISVMHKRAMEDSVTYISSKSCRNHSTLMYFVPQTI